MKNVFARNVRNRRGVSKKKKLMPCGFEDEKLMLQLINGVLKRKSAVLKTSVFIRARTANTRRSNVL
jgi:hypothetical protein